jgi:hypothetical protein
MTETNQHEQPDKINHGIHAASLISRALFFIGKIYRTLHHLKPKQIVYQVFYRIHRNRRLKKVSRPHQLTTPLSFFDYPAVNPVESFTEDTIIFNFQNQTKAYPNKNQIDWNEQEFGKPWNYNLQYASFLNQGNLPLTLRVDLICDLYQWLYYGKLPPEPYPASLRTMNGIRFLSQNPALKSGAGPIKEGIFSELLYLENRLEYHLLANHLLENAFALMMGGYYFNNFTWINKAERIFDQELKEQFLTDGAHFELSPMYHQIVLFRLLEAIYYLPEGKTIRNKMIAIAEKMYSWMNKMRFRNGDTAHFNDSTNGVAVDPETLIEWGRNLGIDTGKTIPLSDSGFRKFETETVELIADLNGISPVYQPGHAHADSHSFILHLNNQPVVVDPSISTYNKNVRRHWERSTAAHNTVTANDMNTAEIWGGFRIGKRPDVKILNENDWSAASELRLNGNIIFNHKRSFHVKDNQVVITDEVNTERAAARFHFAPDITIEQMEPGFVKLSDQTEFTFSGAAEAETFTFLFNEQYHLRKKARGIKITFKGRLETTIRAAPL